MQKNVIIEGNNVDVLRRWGDGVIDLTVTSPPYDNLRDYEGYTFDFEGLAEQLYRVTKEGGIVVWVVGDATVSGSETGTSFRQALHFMKVGFDLYDTMIYAKKNPMPMNHRRYEQQFEYMFVFSKGRPKTFNGLKRNNKRKGLNTSGSFRQGGDKLVDRYHKKPTKNKSLRRNIWSYGVGKGGSSNDEIAFKHPAVFPEQLAEDHILSWSNKGDVVLDPFVGSGTTAKMAHLNSREYVGVDISKEYCELSRKRIEQNSLI